MKAPSSCQACSRPSRRWCEWWDFRGPKALCESLTLLLGAALTLSWPTRRCPCGRETSLTDVFSHWPLGGAAGQTGHLAVRVILVVKGNSCLGWEMIRRADKKCEERLEGGGGGWGGPCSLRGGTPGQSGFFPALPLNLVPSRNGRRRGSQRKSRPGLHTGAYALRGTVAAHYRWVLGRRRDKYSCLQGAGVIGLFLRSVSFLRQNAKTGRPQILACEGRVTK